MGVSGGDTPVPVFLHSYGISLSQMAMERPCQHGHKRIQKSSALTRRFTNTSKLFGESLYK